MWEYVLGLYRNYAGNGMMQGLFFAAIIFLFAVEKEKLNRIFFVYTPMALTILFFLPPFAGLVEAVSEKETYWRMLWLLPIVPVLSYSAVKIIALTKKRRAVTGIALAAVIIFAGSPVYSSPHGSKAENLYHVPREVIEISDMILEGRQFTVAAFPAEMLQYVRQYAATIVMPYGRGELQFGYYDEFFNFMNQEELPIRTLTEMFRDRDCHYLILSSQKILLPEEGYESMEAAGFALVGEVGEYRVYEDLEAPY